MADDDRPRRCERLDGLRRDVDRTSAPLPADIRRRVWWREERRALWLVGLCAAVLLLLLVIM